MYQIVPIASMSLKKYWCSSLHVAQQVALELESRHGCYCDIIDEPTKRSWASQSVTEGHARRVRAFHLPALKFDCSQEQFDDALQHASDKILKIKSSDEIFCFEADDLFWQHNYLHDPAC